MVAKVFVLDEACLIADLRLDESCLIAELRLDESCPIAELRILNQISHLLLFLICHRTMTGVILPRL